MSNVKWIKIVVDIFSDEKILLIESMPDSDNIIIIWFKLLSLAGKINNNGALLLNDQVPYTEEMLATVFRRDIQSIRLALEVFEDLGMIAVVENTITIPNWSKHQSLDQLENQRQYMKKYMREKRKKQSDLAKGKEEEKVNIEDTSIK